MHWLRALPFSVMTLGACVSARDPRPPHPPNVILIVTDDQGWADLGCQGASSIATPRIDRLAREGLRMTDFYVAQPVCSASRASILTGCYANRVGISGALTPSSRHGLSSAETTLAELARGRGYATAAVGKWHLGHLPQFLPTQHGFDRWFGVPYSHDMWPFHPDGPKPWVDLPWMRGESVVAYNASPSELTRACSEEALAFVRECAATQQPFFLYLAHPLPHVPLGTAPRFAGTSSYGPYGDVIQELDFETGRLLDTLEELGLTRDTLVIFTSDNGPWTPYGDHAGSTGPLRESKGTTFEGGVRVPFIARWPGHIPAGRVSSAPAMTIDLLPTIARWIEAPLPELAIDGVDIGALLEGALDEPAPRPLFFYYETNELQALRYGRWKLHFPHQHRFTDEMPRASGGQPAEYPVRGIELALFDLARDIGERRDVALEHPLVVAQLRALADDMRARLGDSLTNTRGTENRAAGVVDDER
ncbi:MAG: sulfatase [Planctomycetes bacterium]|nr:sulfatase [Planctomycetota bacterium]